MRVFSDGQLSQEFSSRGDDMVLEGSELRAGQFNHAEQEPVRPRRRGRPRLNPYTNDKYSDYVTNLNSYRNDNLKETYIYITTSEDYSTKNYKENEDDLKESYESLKEEDKEPEKELKDKNETDTRFTSSSEVLSNFNNETIDNYEVSDTYDTLDNYTTTDEYTTSLNDNSEFPLKSNDSAFNYDETNLTTSNTFNTSNEDEFPLVPKDHFLDKDQDLTSESKEEQMSLDHTQTSKDDETEFEISKYTEKVLPEREKRSSEGEGMFVISEELRQSYIRQSKLLPKIRGVWFNSTVRRMGWVGQAYKKCKRIEKIFSINKHGFEGARKLAIAFRNSQKPTNKSQVLNYPDISLNDVLKPISQLRLNFTNHKESTTSTKDIISAKESLKEQIKENQREKESPPKDKESSRDRYIPKEPISLRTLYSTDEKEIDDYLYPVDYNEIVHNYKSELNNEEKSVRDSTCREALLFMLYELAALVELDFPTPPVSKVDCKRGINFHINFLENSTQTVELLPYINTMAHYICRGITPTDMAHFELYSLIKTLSHCKPLKMEFST